MIKSKNTHVRNITVEEPLIYVKPPTCTDHQGPVSKVQKIKILKFLSQINIVTGGICGRQPLL